MSKRRGRNQESSKDRNVDLYRENLEIITENVSLIFSYDSTLNQFSIKFYDSKHWCYNLKLVLTSFSNDYGIDFIDQFIAYLKSGRSDVFTYNNFSGDLSSKEYLAFSVKSEMTLSCKLSNNIIVSKHSNIERLVSFLTTVKSIIVSVNQTMYSI